MAARINYLLVILIWSTTPLAIKLGGDSLAPAENASLRMILAIVLGSLVCVVAGLETLKIRRNWQLYAAASFGIFPTMALVYGAAEYISSGLISLTFGMSPFFTAALSKPILGEWYMSRIQAVAVCLALAGLAIIFFDPRVISGEAYKGILLMMASNVSFSVSALLVKRIGANAAVSANAQALGGMVFALPGFLLFWFLTTGFGPVEMSQQAIFALFYLAIFGSLVGFAAYFYVLQNLQVDKVALIALMTPVLALILGNILIGEVISINIVIGAAVILLALALYQGLLESLIRRVFS